MKPSFFMLFLGLSLIGCAGLDDDAEDVGAAAQADETANSLTANSLTANALTANALTDPSARDVLKYIVGCALPAAAHLDLTIDGTVYSYDGQLGLAPGWAHGSCDAGCVGAVSSCVLSRLNYLGVRVPISDRGAKLPTTPAEIAAYPNIDGVYYGNIFSSPQQRHACLPPGATSLPRVCGPSLTGCVVDVVGACDSVCDDPSQRDGSYPKCRTAPLRTPGAVTYQSPITVFLQ